MMSTKISFFFYFFWSLLSFVLWVGVGGSDCADDTICILTLFFLSLYTNRTSLILRIFFTLLAFFFFSIVSTWHQFTVSCSVINNSGKLDVQVLGKSFISCMM